MAFRAVLDTCTLFPAHLRDTLLRLAARGLYVAQWSEDILEELRRNLRQNGVAAASVERLIAAMRGAFPASEVRGYRALVQAMTCDPKDRHVLAVAVRADAAAVVTFNTSDFPPPSTDVYEIEVIEPDEFLLDLVDLDASSVVDEIRAQAAANRAAPRTLSELAAALARAGAPKFAERIQTVAGDLPE